MVLEDVLHSANALLGLDLKSEQISVGQMACRAVVVFVVTLVLVRLGKKRFMGGATAFDVILGIILGSVVSRAITGNAPFFPALAASAALVLMHWVFSALALRWPLFARMIRGHAQLLVRDGKVHWKAMRKAHMTEADLWEDLRERGVGKLSQVAEAHLEAGGQLSVIKATGAPAAKT
jgi:uncharacterized membrane protein YcaP (DUF421 family)